MLNQLSNVSEITMKVTDGKTSFVRLLKRATEYAVSFRRTSIHAWRILLFVSGFCSASKFNQPHKRTDEEMNKCSVGKIDCFAARAICCWTFAGLVPFPFPLWPTWSLTSGSTKPPMNCER